MKKMISDFGNPVIGVSGTIEDGVVHSVVATVEYNEIGVRVAPRNLNALGIKGDRVIVMSERIYSWPYSLNSAVGLWQVT